MSSPCLNKVITLDLNEVMVESEDGVAYPKRQFVCKAIPAVGWWYTEGWHCTRVVPRKVASLLLYISVGDDPFPWRVRILGWHKPKTEVSASDGFIRDRYIRAMRGENVVVKWWCPIKPLWSAKCLVFSSFQKWVTFQSHWR